MTKHYEGLERCQHCMHQLFRVNENYSEQSPRNKYCSSCIQQLYPSQLKLWWSDLKETLSNWPSLEELSEMPLMVGELE